MLEQRLQKFIKDNGNIEVDGKEVFVGGGGSWKELTVSDAKTGEVILEKKFVKSGFSEVFDDEKCNPWLEAALEKMMVIESIVLDDDGDSPTDDGGEGEDE
jgi:hypothetical protein